MSSEREKAYMTLPQTTRYAHISLDNILSGPSLPPVIEGSVTGTRTHLTDQPYRYCSQEKLSHLADLLIAFTQKHMKRTGKACTPASPSQRKPEDSDGSINRRNL